MISTSEDHAAPKPAAQPPSLGSSSPEWSTLEVARVRGHTQLIGCKSLQPLKVFNPNSPTEACHIVLSSYGGGMLAGDTSWLRITGQAHTRTIVSTQASTRIFRAVDGTGAEQHTVGTLAAGALAVVFPDPVVLQAGSRYRQVQEWHLAPNSLLLLVDWFHSGRMDQGERFAFDALHTELRVHVAGRLVVLDRFAFRPAEHIATSPANFAGYQTFLSVFLVGNPADARFRHLAAALELQQLPRRVALHPQQPGGRGIRDPSPRKRVPPAGRRARPPGLAAAVRPAAGGAGQ